MVKSSFKNPPVHQSALDQLPPVIYQRLAALKSEQLPFSLVSINIRQFKVFNDAYGFEVGDRALHQLAEVVKTVSGAKVFELFRADDLVVFYPHTDESQIKRLARAIQDQFQTLAIPFQHPEVKIEAGVLTIRTEFATCHEKPVTGTR